MDSCGPTRSLSEATLRRFQRGVNDNGDPGSNGEENQSAIQVVFPPENRVESVLAPESPDGIDQEIDGDWRRCDGDCNCCMEARDVCLEEGYGACNEEGIDGGDLVIEHIFHPPWGVEYEDC